ncbi:hypothetical protein DFQ28_005427 [Apophysomyces sp. BC1034]|nr:hypothetical protein DFQ28_005427 [Apophysomyces sp. BC1034]
MTTVASDTDPLFGCIEKQSQYKFGNLVVRCIVAGPMSPKEVNAGKRRRGRPPRRRSSNKKSADNVTDDTETNDRVGFDEDLDREMASNISDSDPEGEISPKATRKRGRSKISTGAGDHDDVEVKRRKEEETWDHSEVAESETDDAGEEKIDKDGQLRGGREYKVLTFTLPTREGQLLMFAMDPAKILGYRDSYLFFHKNPQLKRIRISEDEKKWLVEQQLLVSWFRNRDVAVVTARSVFKCFGSRIVKSGRRRRDDYFETQEAIGGAELDESQSDSSETAARRSLITKTPHSNGYTSSSPINKATWMHHAALAVRGFNAHLHERRAEKPMFYDIHTNVNQIASATQPTTCTFEFMKTSEEDIPKMSRVEFEHSSRNTSGVRFQGVGKDLLENNYDTGKILDTLPSDIRLSASRMLSSYQREVCQKTDRDETYPLALVEGQYQTSFPIHSTRFNQPDPKIISPLAVSATAQSIMAQQYYLNQVYQAVNSNMAAFAEQAAPAALNAQPSSSGRPPIAKANLPSQNSSPRPISVVAPTPPAPPRNVDTATEPTLCGYITPKGQACKRTVMIPGEKCQAHATTAAGRPASAENKSANASQATYAESGCADCHYLSAPPELLPKDGKKMCDAFAMVKCAKCDLKYHPPCIHLKTPRQLAAVESYPWSCPQCKVCCVCKAAGDETKLMISPPSDRYKYPAYLATYCRKCYDNFNEDRFCPICLKTFSEDDDNDDEDNEMVACDSCDHWIHTGCDETLTPEKYQSLCDDETAKYLCPLCADNVKPLVHTGTAVMALKGLSAPSGYCVGMIGGKIKTRGVVNYKKIKLGVPEINGTGIAEMPRL